MRLFNTFNSLNSVRILNRNNWIIHPNFIGGQRCGTFQRGADFTEKIYIAFISHGKYCTFFYM